ncbi:hypothetical protein SAMN05720470_10872 [Fibrobacter sp. UWOV1]|uniref:hypothetical protein n=1 Tax=Fibrobacter sp. UWOV1 TaxID=1896215 RepID=UPI0009227ABD|nr:hypothetical protein [Fibrobacter sp. UWOV1]SHL43460.1 hypothetical protein SAMN05720470_10872 [Fibrobacter sp. UWOV1]
MTFDEELKDKIQKSMAQSYRVFRKEVERLDLHGFDEYFYPAPVIDNELPPFCKSRHCTPPSGKCATCAYTAMSINERERLNHGYTIHD